MAFAGYSQCEAVIRRLRAGVIGRTQSSTFTRVDDVTARFWRKNAHLDIGMASGGDQDGWH